MSISIGTKERASGDDYPLFVDFSAVDVFGVNAVSAITATATAVTGTAPTLGAVTVSANVGTFRVSGSNTAGESVVTFTATNAASPPNVVVRTGVIVTK